jgi:hypothetical protein
VSALAFAAPVGAEAAPTGPPPIIRLDATGGTEKYVAALLGTLLAK